MARSFPHVSSCPVSKLRQKEAAGERVVDGVAAFFRCKLHSNFKILGMSTCKDANLEGSPHRCIDAIQASAGSLITPPKHRTRRPLTGACTGRSKGSSSFPKAEFPPARLMKRIPQPSFWGPGFRVLFFGYVPSGEVPRTRGVHSVAPHPGGHFSKE